MAGAEDHDSCDEAAFDAAQASGELALSWRAHGLSYGIPVTELTGIGAGAVVTKDVKAGSVMVGNPARCISLAGSWDLIRSRSEP